MRGVPKGAPRFLLIELIQLIKFIEEGIAKAFINFLSCQLFNSKSQTTLKLSITPPVEAVF
jgi:hypothetical protein